MTITCVPNTDPYEAGYGLIIDVAGVVIAIDLPAPSWASFLRERYAAFLTGRTADWRVTVREDASRLFEETGWARHGEHRTDFHIYWYRGQIDLEAATAWVTCPAPARLASAVERTLTYILMQALPRTQNALMVHACGLEIDGRGLVFFGHSGAGKTTVARLAKGCGQVLGDENVVLRLRERGVELVSTPFWGFSTPPELVRRANRSAPLAGLYSLVQAPRFELRRLTTSQAIAALLDTEKVATERVASASAWLTVAGPIVERVPVQLLSFMPTTELWSFLMRHEGVSVSA
jgi:hypothetical protein